MNNYIFYIALLLCTFFLRATDPDDLKILNAPILFVDYGAIQTRSLEYIYLSKQIQQRQIERERSSAGSVVNTHCIDTGFGVFNENQYEEYVSLRKQQGSFEDEYTKTMKSLEQKRKQLQDKFMQIIEAIVHKKGAFAALPTDYSYAWNCHIYVNPAIDITNEAIGELNRAYSVIMD
jgi:hypothetical protein